jgi:hypothetical protein
VPVRLGEKTPLPTLQIEKCQVRSATIAVYRRPNVVLSLEGGNAVADSTTRRPELGRLVKTLAWNGSPPPATVAVRLHETNGHERQMEANPDNRRPAEPSPKDAEDRDAVRAARQIRLADVTLVRQADETWSGAATFDLDPGGVERLDLRLPNSAELVGATVAGMPLMARPIGDGVWRIRLASPDAPQRVEVVLRDVRPRTDRAGRLRFESPSLGDLPVQQTFWTLLLPAAWIVGEPDGATAIDEAGLPQPRPNSPLEIAQGHTPWSYVSNEGGTTLTLACRTAPSQRWTIAAFFLLLGVGMASILAVGKNRTESPVTQHIDAQ